MTREEFFNSLNTGTKWDVGVAINRNNPLPLDASSVYESLEALENYAKTSKTVYVGQICTVVGVDEVAAYQITAIGEGATVAKLAASSASGDVAGDIVALQGKVGQLETKVSDLENIVGNGEGGLVKDTADNAAAIDAVKSRIDTLEGDDTVEGSVAKTVKDAVDAIDFSDVYDAKGVADIVKGELDAYKASNDAAVSAVSDKADDIQSEVDALGVTIGEVPAEKTVVKMIAEAQAAATYDDTALANRVTTTEGKITAIEDDYLKGADKSELEGKIQANADAITLLTDGADAEKIDGVKDLIDYVDKHGAEVTGLKADIANNKKAIEDEVARATGVENGFETRIANLEDYDHAADVQAAKDYADGVAATAKSEAIAAAETNATAKADSARDTAKAYTDEQIAALGIGDYAKTEDVTTAIGTAKNEAIADAEGKIAAAKDEAIAAAKTETETQAGTVRTELQGEIDTVETSVTNLAGRVDGIVAGGGEPNLINIIKVNGAEQAIVEKAVDIIVPTKLDDLTGYTELAALVAKKVDIVEGASLVDDDDIAKLQGLANIKGVSDEFILGAEDGILGVQEIAQDKVTGLADLVARVDALDDVGAEKNLINAIKFNGVEATIIDRVAEIAYELPVATLDLIGGVKSSEAENGIAVSADGIMSINSVNVNKLTQTDGEYLILNGGSSAN